MTHQADLQILANSPVACYSCDLYGKITFYNRAAQNLWARKPELDKDLWCGAWKAFYLNGRPLSPEDHPAAITIMKKDFEKKYEIRIECQDHSFKNLLIQSQPQYDRKGKLTGGYFFLTDTGEFLTDHIRQATLSAIVESSEDAIISKNLDGIITSWNAGAERLLGYSEQEAIGNPITMIIPDSRLHEEKEIIAQLKKGNRIDHFETLRLTKSGELIPLSLSISPLRDGNGKVVGASKVARDISERLKSFEKQAMLSAIVESSEDAIISKNLDGIITSWNAGAERILGYSEEEAIGQPITMIIPKDRLHEEKKIIARLKRGQRIDHFETLRLTKSGKLIPLSLSISPLRDGNGKVVGASKVARDISEKLKSFEKQAMLSAIVESSDDAIISKNLDGIITSWNRGAQMIFGYSEKEAIGKSITMLIPEEKLAEETTILNKIRQGEKIDHFETQRRHKSGREIFVSITVSPVKDHKGRIVGASKVARDITPQVKSKQELQKYTRNLEVLNSVNRSISENLDFKEILNRVTELTTELTRADFGIFFYEIQNGQETNNNHYAVSGSLKEDILKKIKVSRFKNLIPKSNLNSVFLIKDIEKKRDKIDRFYDELYNELGYRSFMAVPLLSKKGLIIGGFLFGHSREEHFRMDDNLLVSNIAAQTAVSLQNSYLFERVKSLSEKKDQFIALASHELRTPLTSIKGYIQLVSKMTTDEKASFFIEKTLLQVEKLNKLIEDLLNMSRLETGKLDLQLTNYDLREVLEDVINTFNYSYQSHRIISKLGLEPVYILGDPQRIEQVIINLISNAIKYSPHANKVMVSLENEEEFVVVKVKDYGIGLKQESQKKLFERFYRADNSRGISGLGIGLYLSKQIIDLHKGTIGVNSEFGKGSEFFFKLPKNLQTSKKNYFEEKLLSSGV